MTDIVPLLRDTSRGERSCDCSFQLRFGWRGYYVFGETACGDGIEIYYDKDFDYIEGTPRHILDMDRRYLVALASVKAGAVFVLEGFFEQLKRDSSGMGMAYIPVSSFEEKIFCCSDVEKLPENFSGIRWIDDDFMHDENKEFDFELFYEIDGGAKFLNPNHFSLNDIRDYLVQ